MRRNSIFLFNVTVKQTLNKTQYDTFNYAELKKSDNILNEYFSFMKKIL